MPLFFSRPLAGTRTMLTVDLPLKRRAIFSASPAGTFVAPGVPGDATAAADAEYRAVQEPVPLFPLQGRRHLVALKQVITFHHTGIADTGIVFFE